MEFGFPAVRLQGVYIFQYHVGCCWDLDTIEKWHRLNLWPFLLFPSPLPHFIMLLLHSSDTTIPFFPFDYPKSFTLLFFPSAFPSLQISTTSNTWRKPYVSSKSKYPREYPPYYCIKPLIVISSLYPSDIHPYGVGTNIAH